MPAHYGNTAIFIAGNLMLGSLLTCLANIVITVAVIIVQDW